MSGVFESLETSIKEHLKVIRASSGLPQDSQSLELLAGGWREKEKAFDDQARSMGMEQAEKCKDSSRGFLALTYSGSLVAVGPEGGGKRRAVYVSIDRRRDVPSRAESEDAVLGKSVSCGREITFKNGPVKKSSAVYRLALLPSALALPEQNNRLEEATLALTKEFQAVDETRFDDI
ncbi:MAG: hypothetical protein J7L76_01120 [Spirochaetaceae bacterium]|nr:hypothetical protein [Spirochaetaceae bacterium]RKX80922.1 MAG: hypothetical protein DRP60_01970 [Spirochaetota bacterium]RKX82273.1 MAG: hypothetical protein DRP70_16635 [Spirochaetota bacterium]RKX97580.1 MAG: hypothetical protein DRZ90_05815 [Spirochaetota bacterium]